MKLFRLLRLSLSFALLPLVVFAVPSDPVGVFKLRLRGNSDTIVSLPLLRPALVEGALTSRAGNNLTLSLELPALPAGGAFVLVMSGALEGAVLPITSVSGSTVSVSAGSYNLNSLVVSNDLLAIVPYWTLDTVFPSGAGVHASTSASTHNSQILFFSKTTVGTNLSAASTFFYFVGNASKPAGWYKVGDTAAPKGNQIIDPAGYFIVRHKIATDTALLLAGGVQMAGFRAPVALLAPLAAQDNLLGLPVATPLSLIDSQLATSGAFTVSTSISDPADQLLVFDNNSVSFNKSASAIFIYFVGNQTKAAGWYRVGHTTETANNFTLKPGEGFVIRRRQNSTARVDYWHALPGYLQ